MNHMLEEVRWDAIKKFKYEDGEDKLLLMIAYLVYAAKVTKEECLFAIEGCLEKMPEELETSEILKKGLELIMEGEDAEYVTEILTAMYWGKAPEGEEALLEYFAIRGMLEIQKALSSLRLEQLLLAYLPKTALEKYRLVRCEG